MLNLASLRLDIVATKNAALLDMLRPGQTLPGRVLPPGPDGLPRLQLAGQTLSANLPNLPAGTAVTVTVEATPQGPRLLVTPQTTAAPPSLPGGGAVATTPTPTPSIPQPVADILPRALANQDSLAPLIARLSTLGPALDKLPANLAKPVMALLSAAIDLDGPAPTAESLHQAVSRSGIFLESRLANGTAPATGDLKSALLTLRQLLQSFSPHLPAAPARQQPAAPLRNAAPRTETLDLAAPPSAAPAHDLAEDADAALDRIRLHQFASLPDSDPATARQRLDAAHWDLELPFVLGNELALAHLQVDEEAENDTDAADRRWRVRFALSFSAIGDVGAEVTLTGKRVGAALWADRDDTAAWLADNLAELRLQLAAAGLEPGHLAVRPRTPPETAPYAAGALSDRTA